MTSTRKRLWILRHGKSDWQATYGDDRDRPLKARGQRAAQAAGELLAVADARLDRVWVSTARRTRDTAELALGALHARVEARAAVEFRDDLYLAEAAAVFLQLRGLGSDVGEILLVGHEPTCSGLLSSMVAGDQQAQFAFPTAALACLELDIDSWAELEANGARLRFLIPPRIWTAERSSM